MTHLWLALALAFVRPGPDLARVAFLEGRYTEAKEIYSENLRSALSASRSNPADSPPVGALLYNLGCCSMKLEEPAEAAWYFRRATLRLPHDRDVARDLLLAEQAANPLRGGLSWTDRALAEIDHTPPRAMLLFVAVAQLVGLLGWVVIGRTRTRKALLAGLILVSLTIAGRHGWAAGHLPRDPTGVVLERDTPVHADPHAEERVLVRIPAGACVEILEGSDRWLRVAYSGSTGWCVRSSIGLVD